MWEPFSTIRHDMAKDRKSVKGTVSVEHEADHQTV